MIPVYPSLWQSCTLLCINAAFFSHWSVHGHKTLACWYWGGRCGPRRAAAQWFQEADKRALARKQQEWTAQNIWKEAMPRGRFPKSEWRFSIMLGESLDWMIKEMRHIKVCEMELDQSLKFIPTIENMD